MPWGGWSRFIGALAAALLPLPAAAIPAGNWTLVDIGTLGGANSYGAAISNTGLVAGCADLPTGGAHAFLYDGNALRDLGPGGDTAAGTSCALAVNNEGVVAGRSTTGELVVWKDATVTRLGVHGDIGGIDDRDSVVGSYRAGTSNRAFLFANDTLMGLGALGDDAAAESHAASINARQQIVGRSNGRAFLYQDGAMRDLGTLGGPVSSAKGVNDHGQVVGMAANANGQPQPFLFDGAMNALPGPSYSGAVAINNRGQVVGSAEGSFGYLIDNGEYTRLDTLPVVQEKGWRRLEPTGINDRGWIVGTAMTQSGDLRAFILIPAAHRIQRVPGKSR
jgi:probable HAF family extracellular repeat protein